MKKFIWLIGENLGNTYDNNSFYFWDQITEYEDEIEKYFVLVKNKKNIDFYNSLTKNKKSKIVWKDSIKHYLLFKKADMYFVSLSYRDILPEKILHYKIKFIIKRPLVYLQHGTIAIKKLGYKGNTYYNNMFRFIYYNPEIKKQFISENDFNEYQLHYGEFHPRYKKTVEYFLEKQKDKNHQKKILFFITWREYFADNFQTKRFINKLNQVFENSDFLNYITEHNIKVELCMHQFYDEEKIKVIKESIKGTKIELKYPNEVNLMKELATCDLLITDYSSVGFDCTLLGIPVLLFQPDCDEYFKFRETYCSLEEMKNNNITKPQELVEKIIKENYHINDFFRLRMPKKINYQDIVAGKHIEKLYNYFYKLQLNRITILGYNFTGKGGTVSATKALAEALLERGYLVELLSLKMTEKDYGLPYGLAINGFYNKRQNKWFNRIKRHLYRNNKDYRYFKYDINKKMLFPYIGRALKKYLENTTSKTIISTRESIHLFVKKFANDNVKNKLYFFHTDSNVLNDYYPNLINEIKKEKLENCIFVTEASKEAYKAKLDFDNYENGVVISNTIESKGMIEKKDIKINKKDPTINAVSLIRLSSDRKEDVDNIISFGRYLVENRIEDIIIKIYGQGDLRDYLTTEILNKEIDDVVYYMGATNNAKIVYAENDCVIDFCNNQSFGMVYIESILNGKPVFAKENTGSLEVLKDIPYSYYHSNEELLTKLKNVKKKKLKEYKDNYDIINKKYSRKIVADEIEKILSKGER